MSHELMDSSNPGNNICSNCGLDMPTEFFEGSQCPKSTRRKGLAGKIKDALNI